ncbi:TerD family protein [Nocardia higoensis]|uniref:TerD family protein n=1 Tax=Nocardia higoensis TaxID=228599 RepID=A0ABS0DIY0_9NOCA|nr:TerD family protein [Nocardia higoensis]MBF6356638.1 TerD family protein [Nocardia higoensis]
MIRLQAGQNVALTARTVTFQAQADTALDVCALVVGEDLRCASHADFVFYNQTETAGVRLAGARLEVTLADLRAAAAAVLLVVSAEDPRRALGRVRTVLTDGGDALARFEIEPAAGESALICLELYQRGSEWKVRAVGQGYAGGLPVLLPAHGVEVDEPESGQDASPRRTHTPEGGGPAVEVGYGLERLWMIFEDAARSAAALVAARDYAAKRLDDELSAAVSDPATRNTLAAEEARQAAQRRAEELAVTAEGNHRRDSEQLMRELAEAEQRLPPALAAWHSPAWQDPPAPADGIRIGELHAPDRGVLRIPYCVPVPLTRPLWIDTDVPAAAAPVVGALLARLLAVDPGTRTRIDVIDLTGAYTALLPALAPVLAGPPITDHTLISERVRALAEAAELAEMAYQGGAFTPPAEHRVLVVSDFPHGYQAIDAARLLTLTRCGDLIGLSILIVGTDEIAVPDDAVSALSQHARHLPTVADTPMFDPWTGSAWQLQLDVLPRDPQRASRLLRSE